MDKIFWLHIKKCGGQSMRKALAQKYCQVDREEGLPFVCYEPKRWNDVLNNYRVPLGKYDYKRMLFAKEFLLKQDFDSHYKFALIRNPYDRAESMWRYLRKEFLREFHVPQYKSERKQVLYFFEMLTEIWASKSNRHIATHTAPYYSDLTDLEGNLLVDELFKIERIQQHWDTLKKKLNIGLDGLEVINRTPKKSPKNQFLSQKNILAKIEELYREDLQLYNELH